MTRPSVNAAARAHPAWKKRKDSREILAHAAVGLRQDPVARIGLQLHHQVLRAGHLGRTGIAPSLSAGAARRMVWAHHRRAGGMQSGEEAGLWSVVGRVHRSMRSLSGREARP